MCLSELLLKNIGFTYIHHREGVWPGNPAKLLSYDALSGKWNDTFQMKMVKFHRGRTFAHKWFLGRSKLLVPGWWIFASLLYKKTLLSSFSFFKLFLLFLADFILTVRGLWTGANSAALGGSFLPPFLNLLVFRSPSVPVWRQNDLKSKWIVLNCGCLRKWICILTKCFFFLPSLCLEGARAWVWCHIQGQDHRDQVRRTSEKCF